MTQQIINKSRRANLSFRRLNMTLLEMLTDIKNLINETDPDEQIDSIIKVAINHSYLSDLSRLDKRLSTAYVPIINGVASLPTDLLSIYSTSPSLKEDKHIGGVIITKSTGLLTVMYYSSREKVINDSDEIDLCDSLMYALTLYGASVYFDYRKKTDMSRWYMMKYTDIKTQYESDQDDTDETVGDVRNFNGGDE